MSRPVDATVVIRRAHQNDLTNIEHCARLAYQHYEERMGQKPAPMIANFAAEIADEAVIVAERQGLFCGFLIFKFAAEKAQIENVAVLPGQQGRGIGTAMIVHTEQAAQDGGFTTIELYTNAKMTENLSYYPRQGYQIVDRRTEDGFDRVYFSKLLVPAR